jgi:4-hydroxybenzoate polyprenyltransferase
MPGLTGRSAVKSIFFGNYFYGLCAVALAVEASLQQNLPLNQPVFYLLLFAVTVLYYSKAYLSTEVSTDAANLRSAWYARNRRAILISQVILLVIFVATGSLLLLDHWLQLAALLPHEWLLLLVFPLVSVFYYGVSHSGTHYSIRKIGWLKPFVIGFTWAGLVTVYPAIFYYFTRGEHLFPDAGMLFLFLKNLMFITVLCIMFDIKDYEMDYNLQLKTFVVKLGPRRTIWFLIIPLCLLGLVSYLFYAGVRDFSQTRIYLNTVPFVLITLLSASLRKERSIFYYLVVIDGLMLVKAACGIAGMML